MKFASTLAALFFLFAASALGQLTIVLPAQGANYPQRSSVPLLLSSGTVPPGSQATVTFSNGLNSFTAIYGVGIQYSVALPWNFLGTVTVTATLATAPETATSSFNVYALPQFPCYRPCYNPYYNRCYRPCEPRKETSHCKIPRSSCKIPRYRCGKYTADGVQEIVEFDAIEGAAVPAEAELIEAEYIHGEVESQEQVQQAEVQEIAA